MLPLPPGGAAHLFVLAAIAALIGGLAAVERKGAFQLMLSRPLTAKEKSIVQGTLDDMRSYFEKQPEAARAFLSTGESRPSGELAAPQLAAMTMVANQLMNLDEVLNK